MTSDTLHESIGEIGHSEHKSSYFGVLNAIILLQRGCPANRKGKITERLHKGADDNGQKEDIHIHRSKQRANGLIKDSNEVPAAFIV